MASPYFSETTLKFLRGLRKNNNREWFRARREQYEEDVRGPMVAIVEQLGVDFQDFAPELVASPKHSIYRVYRDTRFSPDKTPLKAHIASVFPHHTLTKHGGAGLYLHLDPDQVFIGGGVYAPDSRQLFHIRQHIADNELQFRSIIESQKFTRIFGAIAGEKLKRVPRGFPQEHSAAELLKLKQFLASSHFPATFAIEPLFYKSLLRLFKTLTPYIQFLNQPLVENSNIQF